MASMPIGGERAISPKILEILDLPPDVMEDDCLPRVELLKFRKGRIEEFVREEIKRKVNTAITLDRDGISKIYGHEREEMIELGRDYGLAVLEKYIEGRMPIPIGGGENDD